MDHIADPPWLAAARGDIGQRETLGPNDSPWIRTMLVRLGASWLLGEPWCGGACAKWMMDAGVEPPKNWWRARAWATWGAPIPLPTVGCIVVLERGKAFGHVGLVTGRTDLGDLLVLGGNQGNAVSIAAFPRYRVVAGGYRWPSGQPMPNWTAALPTGQAEQSTGEA